MKTKTYLDNESGAVLAMIAVSMVVLLAVAGLALDSGRAYIRHSRMARAIDAAALTGARTLRAGEAYSEQQARAVAAANGFQTGVEGTSINVVFGTNAEGERTVSVNGSQPMPTVLMRLLGHEQVTVGTGATAAIPPVDMTLVLDQSGSLGNANAWDDLQDAAWDFVQNFDDAIDQVGLVSFNLRGTLRVPMQGNFTAPIQSAIYSSGMQSAGDTNAGEGLRLGLEQTGGPAARDRSAKVVVFFTDGRPTAFRGDIFGVDRMMAVYTTGSTVRGYFDDPDNLPSDVSVTPEPPCHDVGSCGSWNEPNIRATARQRGLDQANIIRAAGILIYSIGLGNPAASNPLKVPDMDYLREISNEDGATDPDQPAGKAYFAPTVNELEDVFNQVAQDLLVRLAQ